MLSVSVIRKRKTSLLYLPERERKRERRREEIGTRDRYSGKH